jgi:D-glycero-alpha-D-manno-heptose 1-phosphate guanylyltransferase
MKDFSRYGSVEISDDKIKSFNEKQSQKTGLINGGTYIIKKKWLKTHFNDEVFSFEKDVLEKLPENTISTPYVSRGYFIDIGQLDDYAKACREL